MNMNKKQELPKVELITHEAAAIALDDMDDYAKMNVSVDAYGPRGVLERYIAQQALLHPQK